MNPFNPSGNYYPITFKPQKRILLRNILWNNDQIGQISEANKDSSAAWSLWIERMRSQGQGIEPTMVESLRQRFNTFHDFADLVAMLRESAVESQSNKRWTSRFIFPFGANAIYEDLDSKESFSRDYINFTRTGELLYLMLSRSAFATDLTPKLKNLLEGHNIWNSLLGLLQHDDVTDNLSTRGKSYLPYIKHPIYDELGRDWLTLFNLELPGYDVISHLVTLGAYYIMLYQLKIAAEWNQTDKRTYFICEVVAPRKTLVRELSILNYQENATLPSKAIDSYINRIEQSTDWQEILLESPSTADAHARCKQYLMETVWWDGEDSASTPEALLADLKEQVQQRHKQHEGNVHREIGRDIGFISRRGTTRFRYAPTDSLLKTLLLANVPTRMEFREFLALLFDRYGLVFGEREAIQVVESDSFDKRPFDLNTTRLEQRLSSLGMLRRLSDGCAYVINPLI
ncbi:hypothetical protein IC229_30205 [Spirosoma sp. BT702]|uniref:Uncharacterized protein n=1 Tax=Spirosoma profusum TaxID=2771354 RepID=A0A927AV15_9BACT|nr:hypothetical protein [Spirosoma profusum]